MDSKHIQNKTEREMNVKELFTFRININQILRRWKRYNKEKKKTDYLINKN
jgi:hypothetical protein